MVAPLRKFMLNKQIALEARRIAHEATRTCKLGSPGSDFADEHTKTCNDLKHEIQELAMMVKLASMQPPFRHEAPPYRLQQEDEANE
jgi:hypothetical protein